jgi:molybdopterin-guanine dinucleotide biosynthesis protein B
MAYAICVAGPAGQDKLEFMQALAVALEAEGLKVGLLSQSADNPGAAFWSASAQAGGGALSLWRSQTGELSLDEILGRYFFDLDVVLCHGYDQAKRAKIEFLPGGGKPGLAGDPGLRAVVSPSGADIEKPVFKPEELKGLAGFLKSEVIPPSPPPRIRIVLDGKRIPAKEFVQDILADTIRAMVGALKGGDRPGRMEIFIEPDKS